ncbi:MAG: hypothetical protein ACI4S2_15710 [Lachnospiraceae bacterium]
MWYNKYMKKILRKIDKKNIPIINDYMIEKRYTVYGEDYYCINQNFCFPYDKKNKLKGRDLSFYEWEGNEIFISDSKSKIELLGYSLGVVFCLKKQMKEEFLGIPYDIILTMDIQRKNSSVTIRFYKVREKTHIIKNKNVEKWKQPIIIFNII